MKKFLMIALMLIMLGSVCVAKSNYTAYWTGTTDTLYVAQEEIVTQDFRQAFIIIHNSSATETMYYKIYGYACNAATFYEEVVSETSIAVGISETIKITNTAYSKLVILVKQNSGSGAFEISLNLKP